MTTIAVVIPTLGRMFWVLQLAQSLLRQTRKPDQIVIVDQTPMVDRSPISYAEIEGMNDRGEVDYVFSEASGAALARNVGARHARADILVFLDDDVFVPPYFLERYERIFENEAVHAATGMILVHSRDDGTFKPLVARESLPTSKAMLRGGNFAIRRDVFCRLGGMDERFVRACQHEDWDLAWRLYKTGYKAVWDPGPWCYHANTPQGGGRSEGFMDAADRAYNVGYFFLRHPEAFDGRRGLAGYLTRQFLFNRRNLRRPWLVPPSCWMILRAYGRARAAVKAGCILPLKKESVENSGEVRAHG